ncbi:hypothetical protein SDC9_205664 [bioreactor metagenome]|uniref:Uncharacterized protein n=1 Tax=bioreactor metagenome TaxID=1076179 RepID=A0A645J2Q9_9ZZZZ
MPIVIKHVGDGRYLGKASVRGEWVAVKDTRYARKYKSIASAKAALSLMGYANTKEVEFVEVAE